MSGALYTCDLCGFQSEDRAAVLAHVRREHGVTDPVEVGAVDQADGLLTLRQGDQETVIDLAAWLAEALAGRDPGATIDGARQIDNVLASLIDLVDGPPMPGRMNEIRATARQLQDLWQSYQAGTLAPLPADQDLSF